MTHSAAQTIRTRYPVPPRVGPDLISWKDARSIQRLLTNAGVRCDLTTHVGIDGGSDRPMFLGCTAAEVVAAAAIAVPSCKVNWLKVVKAEQVITGAGDNHESFTAFTSPLLVWAPLKTEGV